MTDKEDPTPGFEPDRRRAREETDRSFIVEASAGTGKTRTLVDRILHLVLEKGPSGPPLRMHEICAITFTEKAAGEMKLRLRQHFQQILSDPGQPAERLDRARQALDDLESAAISTFHSFAVSLLKERPVEAGLDPGFTALNEIQSELFFRKVWEPWIGTALSERNPTLEKALRNGFRLDALEELARILRGKWLTVRDLPCDAPPTESELEERAGKLLEQGRGFLPQALNPEDKLAGLLGCALEWLESPDRDRPDIRKPGNAGAGANWEGGKETIGAVRDFIRGVVEFRAEFLSLPEQKLLYEVVSWIKEDFMRGEWEARKHAGGLLDFDDQLRLACDLLQRNPSVRRDLMAQYRTLLVDEFQDTDWIQWRIVLLLASPVAGDADPESLKPEPGRLFVVGDPKQSIYRFRNADIETYLDIVDAAHRDALGLELLELTTNFRSVPSILEFVDAAFSRVMGDGGSEEARRYQQRYLPFGGKGYRRDEYAPPSVHILGDTCDGEGERRSSREFLELESRRIAALIRRMAESKEWMVRDPALGAEGGLRPPVYGDMAVLLPVLTHANILEDALSDQAIPYVLEGGKFYYARSEVSSAITVLRAVANPNDRVALYGALRSIFFGFSDEDLLRAHTAGLELDYRTPLQPDSELCRPFEILRDLHEHRHTRRASETFEILLRETGAREVLTAHGLQSPANLNKLGRTLRALQGDATFSQVVDLLGMMDEERLAESESRLMEERSNAVRILTIHKAKGLDFPIVFVAALGVQRKGRSEKLLSDPHRKKLFALSVGSQSRALHTKNWKELLEEEKKKEEAELARLLYVALTRARDHMVLSTHTAGWKKSADTETWLPDPGRTRLEPLGPFLEDCWSGGWNGVRRIDIAALDSAVKPPGSGAAPAPPDWQADLEREYRELQLLRENTPTGGERETPGPDREEPDRETAGRRSVRLGIAFHEAMERVDLLGEDVSASVLHDIATRHRLDPGSRQALREMMQAGLSSELIERARDALRSGKRVFREFPFVRALADASVEEGKIDLLFEEEDGWVLVDYKTDRVAEGAEDSFRETYASQVLGYVEALKGFSVHVKEACLLLARTGRSIRII